MASKISKAERKAICLKALKRAKRKSKDDAETGHDWADEALIEYISDEEITTAFAGVKKWYS